MLSTLSVAWHADSSSSSGGKGVMALWWHSRQVGQANSSSSSKRRMALWWFSQWQGGGG